MASKTNVTNKTSSRKASSIKRARRTVAPRAICAPRTPTREQIAHRAHQLWERRGRLDGHELEDWLTAEAELMIGLVISPR